MKSALKFLATFIFVGFIMKIVGEVVHEVIGHGFFASLFGGRITRVYIALLWPYELSYICFSTSPNGFEPWQRVWIDGGGILMCLVVSFLFQFFLLLKEMEWPISMSLFWLAFWTYVNPAGYLIIGGVQPFGDVASLIGHSVLTPETALILGVTLFAVSFFSLSKILQQLLSRIEAIKSVRNGVVYFWFIIPIITALNLVGRGQSLIYLPISLIPVFMAYLTPLLFDLLSKKD